MTRALVLAEHDGRTIRRSSLGAIRAVREMRLPFELLVIGSGVDALADSARAFAGTVLVADDPALAEPLSDRHGAVIAEIVRARGIDTVIGVDSSYGRDVLPRVAALLDAPMVSSVIQITFEGSECLFHRSMGAGRHRATVKLEGSPRVVSVASTAFAAPEPEATLAEVETVPINRAALPEGTRFISRERAQSARPDLQEARVVVSGGRPLGDRETFERLIGGLADVLHGAIGATRAAVDAGMVPSDCQIGQTGQTVAPELYIAVGISGAVQHLAGMRDSKVIVAINRDPDAAIFEAATYGLVGDLHEIVPRMIEVLRS